MDGGAEWLTALWLEVGVFSWTHDKYERVTVLTPIESHSFSNAEGTGDELSVSFSRSDVVKPYVYGDRRVFVANTDRLLLCIDGDPSGEGIVGQVVSVDSFDDCVDLYAASPGAFLEEMISSLEKELAGS